MFTFICSGNFYFFYFWACHLADQDPGGLRLSRAMRIRILNTGENTMWFPRTLNSMSTTTATYMMVSSTTITTLSLQTSWLNCFHELCFKPLNPPLYHTVYTYGVHVMCSLLSKVRRRLIYLIRTRIRYEHLSVICPTLIRIQLEFFFGIRIHI